MSRFSNNTEMVNERLGNMRQQRAAMDQVDTEKLSVADRKKLTKDKSRLTLQIHDMEAYLHQMHMKYGKEW